MLEVVAGIWLFLLTGGAGFLWGRYTSRTAKCSRPKGKYPMDSAQEVGWRELLNFLQYDGSGKQPSGSFERGDVNGETKDHTGADRAGIRPRRSV